MITDDVSEKRIIEALEEGPLCTEDLLQNLGIEPGGGETVIAIQGLMEQRIIKRYRTFVYELMEG